MTKTNKKLIVLSIEILTILTFGTIAFMAVNNEARASHTDNNESVAYRGRNPIPVIYSIKPNSAAEIKRRTTITVTGKGFVPDSIVRKNGSNRRTTFVDSKHLLVDIYPDEILNNQDEILLNVFNRGPGGGYSNAIALKKIVGNKNTPTSASSISVLGHSTTVSITNKTISAANQKLKVEKKDVKESAESLTANVLSGSSGFMPSGIVQWILTVIFTLAIVILWRYVHRSDEKYMASPMKHA